MKNHMYLKELFICSLLAATGCAKGYSTADSVESANLASSVSQAQVKVNMQITDNTGKVIYSDASATSSLVLKSGQNYTLNLSPSAPVSGINYSLQLTQTSAVTATPQVIALKEGANSLSVANQGDYSLKLVVSAPAMMTLTKYYSASVTCASPTFTADSLDPSKISVAAGSGSNLYNLSASGIAAAANGTAPYKCAYDGTGSGIIDTAFVDCNTAVSNFYSNYVASRKVSVVVKDSCNMVYTVSKTVNLPFTVPAIGNEVVFIHGVVSGASGVAVGDSRVDGVNYLATNSGVNNIVQPSFSGSNFTITANMFYKMNSSVKFGMGISLTGIKGTVSPATSTNTLDVSAATIKSVSYSTDQAGDSQAALAFSGNNCTLSNQGVKVVFTSGTPCAAGQTGSGKQATVEVYGNYSCTGLSNTGGAINIVGSFDGLTTLVDSCSGGGGGGGGIVPINL